MESIFAYSLFALLVLAAWHFAWEGVFAPSFRWMQRNTLFTIRDELRELYANGKVHEDAFSHINGVLNWSIGNLPEIKIRDIWAFRRELRKPERRAEYEARQAKLGEHMTEELQGFVGRMGLVYLKVMVINGGGWLPYLAVLLVAAIIPLIVAILLTEAVRFMCKLAASDVFPALIIESTPQCVGQTLAVDQPFRQADSIARAA